MICGAGEPSLKEGLCIYNYTANVSMSPFHRVFYSADGDFLIVPETGTLVIKTELGRLRVDPCEICVIPRGIKFSVDLLDGQSAIRGYCIEVFKGHFELPSLGPIGANGLANPRDFLVPAAHFEDLDKPGHGFTVFSKFIGRFFSLEQAHSPFDVVAWHGNYYPFKYDLRRFNTMNTVSYDHPDPSIYTVLTVPTDEPGVAVCDFVIFPPRWIVADHT